MIGSRARFYRSLTYALDLVIVCASWLAAYPIRFKFGLIPMYIQHVPRLSTFAWMTLLVLLIWAAILRPDSLHRHKSPSLFREIAWVLRAHTAAFFLFVAATFFLTQYKPSRVVIAIFIILSTTGLIINHANARRVLIQRRRRGEGVRRTLIVGTGELGRELGRRIARHPELGLDVSGYVSEEIPPPTEVEGRPVHGSTDDLERVLREQRIDTLIVALPLHLGDMMKKVLEAVGDEMVDVKVVPDLYQYVTLRASVEEFEGMPVVSLNETPLHGWAAVGKRAFDFIFASCVVTVLSPVLLVIAAAVKLTSRGPVFYGQERMGLDGRVFKMLKFRSMRADAETQSGAVWAVKDDPRRTPIGAFLRRTSLDELPQFFHVVSGRMSLVGPRPERPVFIEQFRQKIPRYMLRHKVKAGITGWAQVNGWRGDTDLARRIEFDIYYIENWSFAFDIRIVWMTLYKGFVNKNAY